jgi:hypothetical protein
MELHKKCVEKFGVANLLGKYPFGRLGKEINGYC